jgi:hypothetical protein
MAQIKLAQRTFANRRQAITFLSNHPDYVKMRLGNLVKGSPQLLNAAGYRITAAGRGAGRQLLHNGKQIDTFRDIPEPLQTNAVPAPTMTNKPYGPPAPAKKPPKKGPPKKGNDPTPGSGQWTAPVVAPVSSGVDYTALAQSSGVDPRMFQGINPKTGQLIPLSLANRGSKTMGPDQINALVQGMVGDSYNSQIKLSQQHQADTEAQNAHNLDQISHWYDQVLGSQGVATQRDADFGKAAVQSATDSTAAIVGALGGEANPGSYVAGAAGNENVGNINAISAVQNQYNSDMAPLLAGEKAGQLTREQGLGGQRLRDLREQLISLQSEKGSKEAEMRYNVWQSNNQVLDQRLQNELAIRQANSGLGQQRFQNKMGVLQTIAAAQAAQGQAGMDAAGLAVKEAGDVNKQRSHQADNALKVAIEQAKEAGRNYRARLSRSGKSAKSYASSSSNVKTDAYNDILDTLENNKITDPRQAQRIAIAIASGYGWSVKNPAVAAFISNTIAQAK